MSEHEDDFEGDTLDNKLDWALWVIDLEEGKE